MKALQRLVKLGILGGLLLGMKRAGVLVPIDIPPPEPPELPGPWTECPEGFSRKLIENQWRCWPKDQL